MILKRQRMMFSLFFVLLLTVSGLCHALPFNVFPKLGTLLPTQVPVGQSVTALYTVQNNTVSFRANNFVKYLPPNVTQVISDPIYPDLCGSRFNLAAKGMPGDSCTLELKITGAVQNNDPNPHHHLFVCFPGGTTCAGTLFPLNVITVNPSPPPPPPPSGSLQIAYVANRTIANSISICPLTGGTTFGTCTSHTDPTFDSPIDIILNNNNTFAYVANSNNETISVCPVNSDGTLNTCVAVPAAGSFRTGLRLNNDNSLLYYTNFFDNRVWVCPVNGASLDTCTTDGDAGGVVQGPSGRIAIDLDNVFAYVTEFNNPSIARCTIKPDGFLTACTSYSDLPTVISPLSLELDPTNTYLYAPNFGVNFMSVCVINPDGSVQVPCATDDGNTTFNFDSLSNNMFIQTLNSVSYAYVPNGGSPVPSTISICTIQPDGTFGSQCTANTANDAFATPDGIWVATFPPV